jgi:hypothetical protein
VGGDSRAAPPQALMHSFRTLLQMPMTDSLPRGASTRRPDARKICSSLTRPISLIWSFPRTRRLRQRGTRAATYGGLRHAF